MLDDNCFTCTHGHLACDGCLRAWCSDQTSWHVPTSHVRCFHNGCAAFIPEAVAQSLCGGTSVTQEVPKDVAAQLKLRRLGGMPPSMLIWRSCSSTSRPVCAGCQTECVVLLANEGCQHAACENCWDSSIEASIARARTLCQQNFETKCIAPNCAHNMSNHILKLMTSETGSSSRYGNFVVSELDRLRRTAGGFMVSSMSCWAPGPQCPVCHKRRLALLENPCCSHAACEDCWAAWAETRIQDCREMRVQHLNATCIRADCKQTMDQGLLRHARTRSRALMDFAKEVDAEVARLNKTASEVLVWGSCESGPICFFCNKRCLALLANGVCCHSACEDCWAHWAEGQLPRCRSQLLADLSGTCIADGCSHLVTPDIINHAYTLSPAVKCFKDELQAELSRLRHFGDELLHFGPAPLEVAPECSICRERCLALFRQNDCGHAACEDCWAKWAEQQIPWCRAHKRVDFACFAPRCPSRAVELLWKHSSTRNCQVEEFEKEFARRRRLQNNELFPAEAQVDCPQPGCLGLAYRGYDTLMCFACEYQWPAGEEASPCLDVDVELAVGEFMKKCPACGQFIIKNGGCDHMTCRCRHEFWWSTLLPYRTG